jgi:hypothetical protein
MSTINKCNETVLHSVMSFRTLRSSQLLIFYTQTIIPYKTFQLIVNIIDIYS